MERLTLNATAFEEWCRLPLPAHAESVGRHPKDDDKDISEQIFAAIKRGRCTDLTFEYRGQKIAVDGTSEFRWTAEKLAPLRHVTLKGMAVDLRKVTLARFYMHSASLRLTNCVIAELHIAEGCEAHITECWIGKLVLPESAASSLHISGGSVRCIQCPPPKAKSPFSGTVQFSGVNLPTSRRWKLFPGPQPYRSLRAHLEALQNIPMAQLMRAKELASELEDEKGLIRFVNWFNGFFSEYGLAPERPLVWASAIWLAASTLTMMVNGADLAVPPDQLHGWQNGLEGPTLHARILRAATLATQAINPLSLLETRKLVTASGVGWGALMSVAGLIIDFLLALTFLGVRKRFKMS